MNAFILIVPLLFLFALITAIVGVFLGNMRNRGRAGFWFGFILGPFGWIIVLLMPEKKGAMSAPIKSKDSRAWDKAVYGENE